MGLLINPANSMKILLSNCVKFQEFVGAVDQAGAITKIYTDPIFLNKDLSQHDFYAVIIPNEIELEVSRTGIGSGAFDSTTSTFVNLVGTYEKHDPANSQAFLTIMDELIEEILEKQGVGFKDISFFRRLSDVPYMWSISDQNEDSSFSDRKCGFQIAFEEGMILA